MFQSIFSEAGVIMIAGSALFALIMTFAIFLVAKTLISFFRNIKIQRIQTETSSITSDRIQEVVAETSRRAGRRSSIANSDASTKNSQKGKAEYSADNKNWKTESDARTFRGDGEVVEAVSALLCRQIPIRFEEDAKSWLGGHPKMPPDMAWPYSISHEDPAQGERPLHFLAQICCADIPVELWGGIGPREGWLRFFLDPNQSYPEDSGSFKVLYSKGLGNDRQIPKDLGPVYDGVYTGPYYDYLPSDIDVPSKWRCWPVDVLEVPNEIRVEENSVPAPPMDFAAHLYRGAKVLDSGPPNPLDPFTQEMAIAVLVWIERELGKQVFVRELPTNVGKALADPEELASLTPDLEKTENGIRILREQLGDCADLNQTENAAEWERLRNMELELGRKKRLASFLDRYPSADSIKSYIGLSADKREAWRKSGYEAIKRERELLSGYLACEPLPQGLWKEVTDRLASHSVSFWSLSAHKRFKDKYFKIYIREIDKSLFDLYDPVRLQLREYISDYYTELKYRELIPDEILRHYEAWWRHLVDNRPHRIGGRHDSVQSKVKPTPSGKLLLLQISSDIAMNWIWGDFGACYFWIPPEDLANCNFENVTVSFECH